MSNTIGDSLVSIVVPTYNERENVQRLLNGIGAALAGRWPYEVIIVDDNSPDGTAGAVRQASKTDPAVKLILRPKKLGLGSVVVAGFCIARGSRWVMMDADLSHRPQDLPGLLEGLDNADISVGSRYVPGGSVAGWPLHRRAISRTASAIGRLLVGLRVKDVTSGFVAFRRELVAPLLPTLSPRGFKLLLEILAKSRRATVRETPIVFAEREHGRSKFAGSEVLAFLSLCLTLRRR
jgi:dolichol-phosphate mannosyltransferase